MEQIPSYINFPNMMRFAVENSRTMTEVEI